MEDARAYQELRVGFTAAVSHELRTPLARLIALLESAALPGTDRDELLAQAREEVEQMSELVNDVLFLSELESGREVVALGAPGVYRCSRRCAPGSRTARSGPTSTIRIEAEPEVELPLRRRMLQTVVENLAQNAIRYAGPGATLTLAARPGVLEVSDDGRGVGEGLPRLFERFYRSDRARASRGTGLGLAIVKHVVVSAGGKVDASGGPGRGLQHRLQLPRPVAAFTN